MDKSIVLSDWASGYANSASAKIGGERFWPKSNDFSDEIAKCERILRAFTVEGIETKSAVSKDTTADTADTAETAVGHDSNKDSLTKKKRKVLRKIPPAVIKRAKGIVIYTAMRSGIAPFGGAGGAGLMLARLPDGSWSAPSSISPNNLAVGLLLGFDIFDVILVVNSDRAMESFKSHKVTLGAETAVAAGPFGTGISGEMGIDRSPVFSYVRSRGLYGGVEAMAQVFLHRLDENERVYYWPGITARDILEGKVRKPPIVDPLYRALRDAETGVAQGNSLERIVYETIHAPPNVAVRQLQQEGSAELLNDGERLKLPPTPEELEAMEQAGIPDDFDLALDKKEREEAARRAEEEKRQIMALPPPPKHKKVIGYWESRGTKPGGKRRVAPSPLHIQAKSEREGKTVAAKDEDEQDQAKMDLIDLDEPSKPRLPPRPTQGSHVDEVADELQNTTVRDSVESYNDIHAPTNEFDGEATTLIAPVATSIPSTPKSAIPANLTDSIDSLSRSTSLTRPSRPPRRTAGASVATPRTPTTAATTVCSTTTSTSTPPSLHLFFDWDETITSSDTLSLIAPVEGTQHGEPFAHYTKAYLSDLAKFEEAFGARDNWESQLEFLDKIDEVERASVARVEEGGLFKGMSESSLLERATGVRFRDGWSTFYTWLATQVESGRLNADVISVGWSATFIRHAIEHESSHQVIANIYANQIDMVDAVGTGKLTKSSALALTSLPASGGIRTGLHKLHIMNQIPESPRPNTLKVYVGDSATDLPCLVNADYGLIMKPTNDFDASSINKVIQHTKPPVKTFYTHFQDFLQSPLTNSEHYEDAPASHHRSVLIRIDDWTQALAVIQHIQEQSESL